MIELNDEWRVADEPLQWLLQVRRGDAWHTKAFCRSRAGLISWVRELKLVAVSSTEAIRALHALPEYHEGEPCEL
jgi:hypothetical protein